MRTTTVVFRFRKEPSQEDLDAKVSAFSAQTKDPLVDFFNANGISSDNLVSEVVDHETCLRTVVRSWPDLDTATRWLEIVNSTARVADYPGIVISTQVDPE